MTKCQSCQPINFTLSSQPRYIASRTIVFLNIQIIPSHKFNSHAAGIWQFDASVCPSAILPISRFTLEDLIVYACLCLSLFVFVCLCLYVCVYVCLCVSMFARACLHLSVCVYVCLCVSLFVCVCLWWWLKTLELEGSACKSRTTWQKAKPIEFQTYREH